MANKPELKTVKTRKPKYTPQQVDAALWDLKQVGYNLLSDNDKKIIDWLDRHLYH